MVIRFTDEPFKCETIEELSLPLNTVIVFPDIDLIYISSSSICIYVSSTREIALFTINLVISSSNDKSQYLYRYEYGVASGDDNYKRSITLDEVPSRDEFIKNNDAFVIQKWWETHHISKDMMDAKMYFRSLVESYISNVYPDLKDNILHQDNFTL